MQNSTPFLVYNASAGSGKTFTLVKEYLKILLTSQSSFKFQQILAVTFTNKAAGEMKERVIENLRTFANSEENELLKQICAETGLEITLAFKRSKLVLNAILQNYSAFNITTIDSFTYKIIRTFAYDLGLPLNATVELDSDSLLNDSVDVVISTIGTDTNLTKLLISYALQKSDEDKSWDIALDLKEFSKIILNENNFEHLQNLEKVSFEEFGILSKKLKAENKQIENDFIDLGRKGLQLIKSTNASKSDFSGGGDLPNHFIKLSNFKSLGVEDLKFEGRLNSTIEENKNLFSGKSSTSSKNSIENISEELKSFYYQSKKLYQEKFHNYILNQLIIESLVPLAVLDYIYKSLQTIKLENNLLLNAEFNKLISDSIKDQPSPFIYERLGEKFRYYFIDEMQDTSQLQWQNLIPLFENALISENEFGEMGKLLLVGDAKQSIYRWRGGKAEQFINLAKISENATSNPFFTEKEIADLKTNYRSCQEIIKFNNDFFKYSSQFLTNPEFSKLFFAGNNQNYNNKSDGYVQISFVEKQKDDEEKELIFPKKVAEIIQNLDSSFQKSDVCVLVRTKNQGVTIANYLSENGIDIISSETLLLKNNAKVNFIIDVLNAIQEPSNKKFKINLLYFLYEHLNITESKHEFFTQNINLSSSQFFKALQKHQLIFDSFEFLQLSFYESVEYVVRSFNLVKESDAYIQFFLDVVFEFQQKKQASLIDFLEYWDIKKESLSIVTAEAKNAVRIMTIHKAKGLEFPVVIFPFDIDIYRQINPKVWYNYQSDSAIKSVLINYSKKLNYIGEQGISLFEERRKELEFDNFNILYVALTRAVEQLYVVTSAKSEFKKPVQTTSDLFGNFLNDSNLYKTEQHDYFFGNKKRSLNPVKNELNSIIQQSFISNSWKSKQITIAANSAILWDTVKGEAIEYGNLIHEILSKIYTNQDIQKVTEAYVIKGIISISEQEKIIILLTKIVNHPKLLSYFNTHFKIYNERELLTDTKEILIPDRLIFEDKNVSIIDYKTGKPELEHQNQIKIYAKALEKMSYKINQKLLVYIAQEIIVEEVE